MRNKLDLNVVKDCAEKYSKDIDGLWNKQTIPFLQVAVYTMIGGGLLGRMAAEQPADFYIDSRVGKLPYPKRDILQAVAVLAIIAEANGLDPHNLPKLPPFHNLGIF